MNPELAQRDLREAEPPSIADAMNHVVDAGERLVSHHLELAVVELRQSIEKVQQAAQLTLATLLLAGTGWIFTMLAFLAWLETFGSRALAAFVVGSLQFVLAAVLLINRRHLLGGR